MPDLYELPSDVAQEFISITARADGLGITISHMGK